MREILNKLSSLTDELSNTPEAWRGPERALIRVITMAIEELVSLVNEKRTEDE
tara:strand:+ start:143 stop:301 length:159 start_codon:yes stop_codon:yes gene_type:complete